MLNYDKSKRDDVEYVLNVREMGETLPSVGLNGAKQRPSRRGALRVRESAIDVDEEHDVVTGLFFLRVDGDV